MQEKLFKVENLCFNNAINYGDIKISKDKVTYISGESGSGKSTLLKLFNGILTPSSGNILYDGRNILEIETIQLRREVSLISQDVFLFDSSIQDNFRKFYEYRELTPPTYDEITKFIELCCAPFPLDKNCTTMSGGERQRVYIAIFLSFLPKVIMLDEPTSALDDKISKDMMENILSFCKKNNISVLVVSHNKMLTERFSEDIIVIKGGVD